MADIRSIDSPSRHSVARSDTDRVALDSEAFARAIAMERKRIDRSKRLMLLVLLDLRSLLIDGRADRITGKVMHTLFDGIRETDILGWHEDGVLGIIFTEIDETARKLIESTLLLRIKGLLYDTLSFALFARINISTYLYPEEWDSDVPQRPSSPVLYPDLDKRKRGGRVFDVVKRLIDIIGSLAGLIIASPLMLVIGILVKLPSRGPVFFRQQRVGQYGAPFTFIKFRSMYVDNDPTIHRNYVEALIRGKANSDEKGQLQYKLAKDARVTPIGALLRKSSLDELPQLFIGLKGEMSLVGPRPAIPYEVNAYEPWHRSRVLEAKPGITGLWQVKGRSRVSFDEMVRLDVRYARAKSLWLDVCILAKTPCAVISGQGAC